MIEQIMIIGSHIAASDSYSGDMNGVKAGAKARQWEDYPPERYEDYNIWDNKYE